ncbi:MAG: hypothetical protein A2751_01275 [Candidatus Doudnabacteria bacterium RIFCSPHIGHO2_01_FULL_46_14]|uniref:AMP-dependent synthetase/ligase domain-containing protein n=1 Tax=Candidatus Doudnabacteria bacterium RIFCSPHIGHO2_01_FULL_46_14 TaxID=1817824 RepID=A0A1F5NM99_9BACT|nr:MAG: hypothetical protein A2751_01275 [Candidatus Doudnabacteria bacterium RIFCSPHIGHO2_01_FULL_46_14]
MPVNLISSFKFQKKQNWITEFFRFNTPGFEKLLRTQGESFWKRAGEKRALTVFHEAARRVPAYKDFLKKNKINPQKIKTVGDFSHVPHTDKKNYVSSYPIHKRCWDEKLSESSLVAMSSGTSGEPNFWPRDGYQEFEAAIIHETIYRNFFQINKYKTLLVIGFPMGVYVSGLATTLPSWLVAQKNNLTIITAGNNKTEVLRTVRNLRQNYEQIILVGHPFFIKDIIETGTENGMRWDKKRLRMMFCSEGFNEQWRDYLLKKAGIKAGRSAILSTYGSSEMLLMAHETPQSIKYRQILESDPALSNEIFGRPLTPNLFQFNPLLRHITSEGGELIFTAASGTPLIRFNLHDSGKIIPYEDMKNRLGKKISANDGWQLPFLALYGRSDYTVILYAANIYPEHIHSALNHRPFLNKITGKFAMRKGYLKNMDEYLEINIELKTGIKSGHELSKQIQSKIYEKLKDINMEFRDASMKFPKNTVPKIVLHSYQDPKYFKPGLKPRYIV